MKALLLCVLLLAGCSSNTAWKVSAGTSNPGASVQAHAHGSSGLATLFGLTILAAAAYEAGRGGPGYADDARQPPEMAPDRRISEQDCTKPLDYSLGNIRCK